MMWQLDLKRYFFPETAVKSRKDHIKISDKKRREDPEIEITLGYGINSKNKLLVLNVTLETVDLSEEDPYEFKISAFGSFQLESTEGLEELDEEFFANKKQFARNCAQILIGSIRDHLLGITAKAPFGPLYLETVYIGLENIPDEHEEA